MKYSKSIFVVAIAALLIGPALALTPVPTPDPLSETSSNASAGALAGAVAGAAAGSRSTSGAAAGSISGGGNATGGRSDATGGRSNATGGRSNATAGGGRAAAQQGQVARGGAGGDGGTGGTGGTGNGSVDVGGDQNDYDSKALALSLPGLVAAPAVPGECRLHTRGWGGFSAGATGGTKFDEKCMAHQHCLNLADRLAAWGYLQAAARQLNACEGVALISTDQRMTLGSAEVSGDHSVDLSSYPTRDEVIERDERIVKAIASK